MIQLTPTAITKVHEILESQDPKPAGLRIAVVGGGCSGFSYSMAFETNPGMLDKTYNFEGPEGFRRPGQPPLLGRRRGGLRRDDRGIWL